MLSELDKEKLVFIQNTDSSVLMRNNLKDIFYLYKKIFGRACTSCGSKVPGYIRKLKFYKMEKETEKKETEKLFELHEGVIIRIMGTSIVYSEHNITDEASIEILRDNINAKALFKRLPENLDEILELESENKINGKAN